jgi:hypothetical protein
MNQSRACVSVGVMNGAPPVAGRIAAGSGSRSPRLPGADPHLPVGATAADLVDTTFL